MATAIQRRRGNTAQHASFTGLAGEITIDTDKNTVVVHDGTTAGGYPLAKASDVAALGGADITAVIAGSGLTGGASSGNATISLNYENLAGNLIPSSNNTYSLGSTSKVWKDVYVGPGSLYVNGQKVLADNSGTITLSADAGQNLSLVTTSGGDLELNSNTGDIQLKSNIIVSAGKTITASGGLKLASNLDVNSQYINNLTNPVQAQDAATKGYVDGASYLTGGDGIDNTAGTIAVDGTVVRTSGTQTIGGAKTFSADVVVSGNLTVSGTTTTVNSETISLADNLIDLNSNFTTGSPTENAGIRIKRGDSSDVQVRWNEADDKWQFTNDGSTYADMLTTAQVKALFSATDSGGDGSFSYSDGVFTYTGPSANEVRAHFTAGTGVTLTGGNISIGQAVSTSSNVTFDTVSADLIGNVTGNLTGNVTGTITGTVTSLANHDTTDLAEGSNLYFTTARARSNISVVDNGGDGSLSYDTANGVISYTGPSSTEVRAHFTGGAGLTYTTGEFAVGAGTGITVNADDVAVNVTYIKSLFSATDSGGDGSFSYSDGVFTYVGPSQAEANARIDARISVTDAGGDGSLSYSAGVFTYTGPSQAEANTRIDARLSGTNGVNYNSGVISLESTTAGNGLTFSAGVLDIGAGDGISVTANAIALASTTAGGGLTYTSGVLAVGAGNYITVAADSIAVDATTTATASKVAARDSSGDIYANIFQGTATSARYADLAERYEADAILEPGTVVCFGGAKEITACDHENDHAVAGVVSTDPAYMMNSAAGNNDTHPYVALTGRVPVKVVGPVAKGDLLVASGVKGHAMVNNNAKAGTIIGKAIGSSDSGEGVVEALINLM